MEIPIDGAGGPGARARRTGYRRAIALAASTAAALLLVSGSMVTAATPKAAFAVVPSSSGTGADCASVIGSNFNGTAIDAGDFIWFNSHFKVGNVPAGGVTIKGEGQVTFDGTTLQLPRSEIHFGGSGSAATHYDAAHDAWITNVPANAGGNVFITGLAYQVPTTIPGGAVKSIDWSESYTAPPQNPAMTLQWQWSAAVYTQFTTRANMDQLGVLPTDQQGREVGTPMNYRAFVIGGARGGGGSNFTGSNSATQAAVTCTPPPPTLKGHIKVCVNTLGYYGGAGTYTFMATGGRSVSITVSPGSTFACDYLNGRWPVGTNVTVQEQIPSGGLVTNITVDPSAQTVSKNIPAGRVTVKVFNDGNGNETVTTTFFQSHQ